MTTAATTPKAKPARAAKPAPAPVKAEAEVEVAATPEAVATEAAKAIEQTVKATQEAAAQNYDKAVAAAKEHVEAAQKAQAQAVKSSEEALAAAKENLDAVVKAGQLLAQGLQELSKSVVTLTQEAVEENLANTKKLLAARTMHEAIDLHASNAKAQIDRVLAEGTRLSESTRKLFEEALAPIQGRLHATVDKLTKRH